MSSENREALNRIYEGWERGDFKVGVADFEQNAIMVIDPEIPDEGVYVGVEGIRDYTTRFLEAWKSLTIEPKSFTGGGDTVLVAVKQTGTGEDSGAAVTLDYFHIWTFRAGKIIRLDSILREPRAIEVSGLTP